MRSASRANKLAPPPVSSHTMVATREPAIRMTPATRVFIADVGLISSSAMPVCAQFTSVRFYRRIAEEGRALRGTVVFSLRMRLFTGITLSDSVIARLSAAVAQLRSAAPLNWSPVENIHITCRFIGEWPEDALSGLTGALATVPMAEAVSGAIAGPIPVHISRFGFFPNPHHPHSLFAGVQAGPRLADLARSRSAARLSRWDSRPKPGLTCRMSRWHVSGNTTTSVLCANASPA